MPMSNLFFTHLQCATALLFQASPKGELLEGDGGRGLGGFGRMDMDEECGDG